MKRARPRLPSGAMLLHFTRAGPDATALDNLIAILHQGRLCASTRMVRGNRPVVCLFDTPLSDLATTLHRRNRRRYEPFGIAIDKPHAFRMGARPVIYLPWHEAQVLLAAEQLWRVVRLEVDRTPPIDWSFEREWRIAGDLAFAPHQAVALVETWHDAEAIFETFNGNPPCAGVIPLREVLAST